MVEKHLKLHLANFHRGQKNWGENACLAHVKQNWEAFISWCDSGNIYKKLGLRMTFFLYNNDIAEAEIGTVLMVYAGLLLFD